MMYSYVTLFFMSSICGAIAYGMHVVVAVRGVDAVGDRVALRKAVRLLTSYDTVLKYPRLSPSPSYIPWFPFR
jgi:hypothetical protein